MPPIALVDDDRNILTFRLDALEAEGYRHHDLHGWRLPHLTASAPAPPDLAILDIKMPSHDLQETLRRLRQKSDLPVIFLPPRREIDDCSPKIGADDFIRKRFRQASARSSASRPAPRGAK